MTEYKVRVYENRTEWRNQNDELHRLDGPAVEWTNGAKFWYADGKLHRLNGPAEVHADGSKFWEVNGKLHRLDGPAIEWANGSKFWYVNDDLHRLDGPAREWWIEGVEYSEVEFNKKVKEMNNSCEGKIVEIDGKKYKLTEV